MEFCARKKTERRRSMIQTRSAAHKSNISDRGKLRQTIPAWAFMLLLLLALPSALILPLSLSNNSHEIPFSWAVCILSGIITLFISRRTSTTVIFLILCFFIIPYAPSPVPFAMAIGLCIISGIYSSLTAASRGTHALMLIASPALAFVISYILTRDGLLSLSALIPFPPALAMGLISRRKQSRAASTAAFAGVLLSELILLISAQLLSKHGTVSWDIIRSEADLLQSNMVTSLENAVVAAGNTPLTAALSLEIEDMIYQLMNSLVGAAIATAITFAAIVQKTAHSVFERFELEELQNESGSPIRTSVIAALVFTVSHILSFTSSASNTPSFLAVAALNINISLMPIMLYVGFTYMSALPKKIGFLSIAVWLGALILSVLLSSSLLSVLSLIGAACTMFSATDAWAQKHYGKGEDL